MKNFFLNWFMTLGYKVKKNVMWISHGRGSEGEASFLARLTRTTFREPVEFEPPGPKNKMLFHTDIDPNSGRPFRDYLKRREQRKKEEEALKAGSYFGFVDDVRPDE